MSTANLKYDLEALRPHFFLEENEDNWEKISKAMLSFSKICERYNAYESAPAEVITAVRSYYRPIISSMGSERTRLSGSSMDMLSTVAASLGPDFEPLVPTFFPPLLALCARTSKVVVSRARSTIFAIIEATQLVTILSFLAQNVKDKSASLRMIVAEATLACLNSCNPPDLEKETRAKEIESIIHTLARDANADVRKIIRKVFESYKILLPHRVDSFTAPMTPTMRKYLDVKNAPNLASSTASKHKIDLHASVKQPSSNSASTSTSGAPRPSAHSRSASSTVVPPVAAAAQARNLATTLTRVSRPAAPTRPQPTQIVSEAQAQRPALPPSRPIPRVEPADSKESRPVLPPLRSQRSAITRVNSAAMGPPAVPHRMVLQTDPTSAAASSGGPRRVPIPPPAPAPEPKEKDLPKRVIPPAERPPSSRSESREADRPKRAVPTPDPSQSTKSETKDKAEPSRPVIKAALTVGGPSKRQTTMPPPPAPSKKATSVTADRRAPAATNPAPPSEPVAPRVKASKSTSQLAQVTKSTIQPAASSSKPKVPSSSQTTVVTGRITAKPSVSTKSTSATTAPVKGKAPAPPTKPTWGARGATSTTATTGGVSKPTASSSQRSAAAGPTRAVTKKPSTIRRVASTIAKIKRPVTPALVALPPSPEPTDAGAKEAEKAPVEAPAEVVLNHEAIDVVTDTMPSDKADSGKEESGGLEKPKQMSGNDASAASVIEPASDSAQSERLACPDEFASDVGVGGSEDALPLEDSNTARSSPTTPEPQSAEEPLAGSSTSAVSSQADEEAKPNLDPPKPPFRQVFFSTYTEPKEPVTPSSNPYLAAELAMNGKTPISALLFSIERGFSYTPSAPPSPLSPPEKYANGVPPPSEPRVPGPMLPFNHALHSPSMTFGNPNLKRERQLDHTQINVVGIDSTRLFNMTNLALEEPIRPTYTDMQS